MNVLWFLPILSIMMFVHELGHFVTARLFGITVLEFGFGLPPRMFGCHNLVDVLDTGPVDARSLF